MGFHSLSIATAAICLKVLLLGTATRTLKIGNPRYMMSPGGSSFLFFLFLPPPNTFDNLLSESIFFFFWYGMRAGPLTALYFSLFTCLLSQSNMSVIDCLPSPTIPINMKNWTIFRSKIFFNCIIQIRLNFMILKWIFGLSFKMFLGFWVFVFFLFFDRISSLVMRLVLWIIKPPIFS